MESIENQTVVIFGGSGDLTKRKLIPSLFQLYKLKSLPSKFAVLGVARTDFSDTDYRQLLQNAYIKYSKPSEEDVQLFSEFLKLVYYQQIDTLSIDAYEPLKTRLADLSSSLEIKDNYLYYLSTPPALYDIIPEGLKAQDLHREYDHTGFRRIIIEKPFGYDLESAQRLNKHLKEIFEESQIYRIDHYLGKETVQNILVLRFANGIFENLWNRNYIDRIEVTAIENLSIEGRGGYYDKSGALRDMVQNHLAQLVAITAMEPPSTFNAENFRNEVLKVYQAFRPMSDEDIRHNVVRGQYTHSTTAKGENLAYRDEEGVDDQSRIETYVAMKLFIDNFRWQGVPFYIRTGKQMPTKVSEIVVHFKSLPHQLFKCSGCNCNSCTKLIIRIQPDEGIQIKFGVKIPGSGFNVHQTSMDFKYDNVRDFQFIDAYSRLLLDGMMGDSTLFTRTDAVETSWMFFDNVLKLWEKDPEFPLYGYPAGTWGPKEAEALMNDASWTNPCKNLTNTDLYCEL